MHFLYFSLLGAGLANAQLLSLSLGGGVGLNLPTISIAPLGVALTLPSALPSDLLEVSLGAEVGINLPTISLSLGSPTAITSDLILLPTLLSSDLLPEITLPAALPSGLLPTATLQLPVISLAASALLPTSFLAGPTPTPVFYTCPDYDGQTVIENSLLYVLSCEGRAAGNVFTSVPAATSFNDCFAACDSASTLTGALFCTGFTYTGAVNGDGAGICELQNSVAQSFVRADGEGNFVSAVRVVNYVLGGNVLPVIADNLPTLTLPFPTDATAVSLPVVSGITPEIPLPVLSLPLPPITTLSLPTLSFPIMSSSDNSLPTAFPLSTLPISPPGMSVSTISVPGITLPTGLTLSTPTISLPSGSLTISSLATPSTSRPFESLLAVPTITLPSLAVPDLFSSAIASSTSPLTLLATLSTAPIAVPLTSGLLPSSALSSSSISNPPSGRPSSSSSATLATSSATSDSTSGFTLSPSSVSGPPTSVASLINPASVSVPATVPSASPVFACPEDNSRSYLSPSGRAFKVQCGTDYPSNTIATSPQRDLMACLDACSGVNNSVAVTFIALTCSCKSSTTGGVSDPLAESASLADLSCGPNDDDDTYIDSLGGEYQILCNLTFPQATIITSLVKRAPGDVVPVVSCSTQCTRLTGCIAVTSPRGGQCIFISDLGPSIAAWTAGDTIVMAGKRVPAMNGSEGTTVSTSRPTIAIPSMTTILPNSSLAQTGFLTITTSSALCASQITTVLPVTTVFTTATVTTCSAQLICSARPASSAAMTATVTPRPCLVNAMGDCVSRSGEGVGSD